MPALGLARVEPKSFGAWLVTVSWMTVELPVRSLVVRLPPFEGLHAYPCVWHLVWRMGDGCNT